VLGERWSLLILRDMVVGTTRFNDIARGLPGLSRSLLSKRLRQLEAAGVVERHDGEYLLTDAGRELEPVVFSIGAWGAAWAFGEPEEHELDPETLVWWIHKRMDTSDLPGRRQVFHIRFTDDRRRYWILVEDGTPSICVTDPGFDVNVTITSDVASLYEVWLGRLPLKDALRTGRVSFEGSSTFVRRMPSVLQLSPVSGLITAHH
jgi:DNA-binding HxlR family transcriptional regulator